VGAGQFRQPPHLGVRGGQVLGEHDQAVRAQRKGARAQRGRDQREIAQRDLTDLGLGDVCGQQLLDRGGGRTRDPRRPVADPQLVAGVVQAEHAGGVVPAQRRGQRRRGCQRFGAGGDVVVGELFECLPAGVQCDHGEPGDADLMSPAGAPAQGGRAAGDPGDVPGVRRRPQRVEITLAFGEHQVQVDRQSAVHPRPADHRPSMAACQVGQARLGGAAQPGPQVRMHAGQTLGAAPAQPLGVRVDREAGDVGRVVRHESPGRRHAGRRLLGHERDGRGEGCRAHRAPARAAAYSVASVAAEL